MVMPFCRADAATGQKKKTSSHKKTVAVQSKKRTSKKKKVTGQKKKNSSQKKTSGQKKKETESKDLEITNLTDGYVLPAKKTQRLKVKRLNKKIKKKNLTYRSSNTKVAKVSKTGKVTARKSGTCYIFVYNKRNKKQKAGVKLYVGKRIDKLSLKKIKSPIELNQGQTKKLKVQVKPSNAANKKLIWTSSAPAICKVSAKGNIQAVAAGQAVVTGQAADGSGKKVKCTVKVLPTPVSASISSPIEYPYMSEGTTIRLKASIKPANASQKVVWSSSDTKIAKVDQSGNVSACGKGTVMISATSATASNVSESYKITVPTFDKKKITLIAHRGYSGIAPENTQASFKKAAAQESFGGIECDIYRTTDGVYVIHHDSNLKRIFGLNRLIYECSYDEISSLFAIGGNNPNDYPIEDRRICLLDQYMEILKKTDKKAVIELKQTYSQEVTDELFDMITSYGINDRMDIISFSFKSLDNISKAMDNYVERHPGRVLSRPDIYLLTEEPLKANSQIGSKTPVNWALDRDYNLSIKHTEVTADIVKKAHKAGKKVSIWTVDNYENACHYIYDFGVDCVTSNQHLFK